MLSEILEQKRNYMITYSITNYRASYSGQPHKIYRKLMEKHILSKQVLKVVVVVIAATKKLILKYKGI